MSKQRPTTRELEWLHRLSIGPAHRAGGRRIGFNCMQYGWTEWNFVDRHGVPISMLEAKKRWGDTWFGHVTSDGERLTDTGRHVLEEHSK
jgi:hypothetical protein